MAAARRPRDRSRRPCRQRTESRPSPAPVAAQPSPEPTSRSSAPSRSRSERTSQRRAQNPRKAQRQTRGESHPPYVSAAASSPLPVDDRSSRPQGPTRPTVARDTHLFNKKHRTVGNLNELRGVYEGMRRALLVSLIALVCAPAAAAKEGKAVVVIGPNGRALVEPFAPFTSVLGQFDIKGAVPTGPYVLVYPLMERGIPMRPGRWYPSAGVLCSGWRTGVEAGCTKAPHLRGWLGRGIATGLFRGAPTRLTSLARQRIQLPAYSNEATAIEMSLNQVGRAARAPNGLCLIRRPLDGSSSLDATQVVLHLIGRWHLRRWKAVSAHAVSGAVRDRLVQS